MLFELWIAAISEDQRLRRGAQRQLRRHPGGRLLHDRRHVGREGEGGEAGRGGRRQVRAPSSAHDFITSKRRAHGALRGGISSGVFGGFGVVSPCFRPSVLRSPRVFGEKGARESLRGFIEFTFAHMQVA